MSTQRGKSELHFKGVLSAAIPARGHVRSSLSAARTSDKLIPVSSHCHSTHGVRNQDYIPYTDERRVAGVVIRRGFTTARHVFDKERL